MVGKATVTVSASAPWQWLATNAKAAIYARTETLEDGIVANAVSKIRKSKIRVCQL